MKLRGPNKRSGRFGEDINPLNLTGVEPRFLRSSIYNLNTITIEGAGSFSNCQFSIITKKVAGSIPDGVIGIFHSQSFRLHYGPGVDSASNRNEYQKYFLGVKATGAYGWQPYHLHVPIVLKSGSLNLLEPSGPVQTCNGIAS